MGERLGDVFDRHPNALNLVRLGLALQVMSWHAVSLQGHELPKRLQWFVSDIGVDAFFAVSGFLICRAWLHRPHFGNFMTARARRILPGLWVCLVVTAFVIVPGACWLGEAPRPTLDGSVRFVIGNAAIAVHQWGIDNTSSSLHVNAWNGSLWTLLWEVFCYLLVAALGLTRLLRTGIVLGTLVAVWSYLVVLVALDIDPYTGSIWLWMPPRASLMFLCGAALWLCRFRVSLDWRLALGAFVSLAVSIAATPDYRVLGAPAVAYLAIWVAVGLGRRYRWSVLRTDLSYGVYIYAFPLQQALLLIGFDRIPWPLFLAASVGVVVPVAAISWWLVERPASYLRRGRASCEASRTTASVVAETQPTRMWVRRKMAT